MTQNKKDSISVQRLLVPKYILATGKFLTAISPFLASRFAARLFLTPFKYSLPAREKEMDEKTVQTRHTIPAINREITVYEFGTSPKKVLLAHGWSGRGTQLAKIAEALLKAGYSTISFDAPAHGKAPGKKSMMPYFIESIHFLEEKYGPFEAALGHSLGGMSCLKAVKEGLDIKKLVIIGTANSVTNITREFTRSMKMNDKVARMMKCYLDKKFKEDMDNYSGVVSAKGVKIPTLIIHDVQDIDVNVNAAYEINEVLQRSELFITRGLGHRRILGNKNVINKITTFIRT